MKVQRGRYHTETFDVLDCSGRKTGAVISRDEAHRTGVWHGAFHCLIVYEKDGAHYVLFQRRSSEKKIAPDKYDVSVGGHYSAGEDARAAGPRELKEELGLDVRYGELLPLGRRIFVYCFTPGVVEYEFQDVFFLPRTISPGALELQADEVSGVLEAPVDAGIHLFSKKTRSIEGTLFAGGNAGKPIEVQVEDFVPCLDGYYLKLLLLARRYFSGEREHLVI